MLCQRCKQYQATMHLYQNVNGVTNEIFLCPHCAQGLDPSGINPSFQSPIQLEFHNLFPHFFGFQASTESPTLKSTVCPSCQMPIDSFEKNGKLGCGNCYHHYFKELYPVISRLHGNVDYKGKKPGELLAVEDKSKSNVNTFGLNQSKIVQMKEKLKQALAAELYEQAATIRDTIKALEQEDILNHPSINQEVQNKNNSINPDVSKHSQDSQNSQNSQNSQDSKNSQDSLGGEKSND